MYMYIRLHSSVIGCHCPLSIHVLNVAYEYLENQNPAIHWYDAVEPYLELGVEYVALLTGTGDPQSITKTEDKTIELQVE